MLQRGPLDLKMHQPFLRLESRWGVSGDEEEGSHRMHVTQSCRRQRGQVTDCGFTDLQQQLDSRCRRMCEWLVYLRGAPSAISMAVIPQDHRSLCTTNQHSHADVKNTFPPQNNTVLTCALF